MRFCKKCNESKEDACFYQKYGRECKECCKERVRQRRSILAKDPNWNQRECERIRDRYYRLNHKDRVIDRIADRSTKKRYREKYAEKIRAHILCEKIKAPKGFVNHHWSYNKEHVLCVIQLTQKDHYTIHREIKYDQDSFMYRNKKSGEFLDTREKHENFIKNILKQ